MGLRFEGNGAASLILLSQLSFVPKGMAQLILPDLKENYADSHQTWLRVGEGTTWKCRLSFKLGEKTPPSRRADPFWRSTSTPCLTFQTRNKEMGLLVLPQT